MGHEAIFVLVPKEKAKDSFEARKLAALRIENEIKAFYSPPYPRIGGDFSGLLSDLCGGKPTIPYFNKELRDSVRKNFSKFVPEFKKAIEISKEEIVRARVSDIKNKIPEFIKYNDAELLDAFRLELAPMGLDVNIGWTTKDELVFAFRDIKPYVVTPDLRENGRDMSLELGYEDDAMIINECLYREIIDKMKGKQININDIEKGTMALAARGGLKEIISDVIGKKWIILVDYVD